MRLRLADLQDAPVLAELSRQLIENGLVWRYTPARISALIRDPDSLTLVACAGPQIAGFAVLRFADVQAHLVLLCVLPAQQRQGLGRALCDWLWASARVAGIESVQLELRADNPGAWLFYRRLGFPRSAHRAGVLRRADHGPAHGVAAARRAIVLSTGPGFAAGRCGPHRAFSVSTKHRVSGSP